MLSGAAAAIRRLNEARMVVTNQSGFGRGYFPEALVLEVHERLVSELAREGARVDGVYYCPHVSSDDCACRKPKTGMLEQAAADLRLALDRSFVVGDRAGRYQPDFVAADLSQAVEWILEDNRR